MDLPAATWEVLMSDTSSGARDTAREGLVRDPQTGSLNLLELASPYPYCEVIVGCSLCV